jgi:hypothetical protein
LSLVEPGGSPVHAVSCLPRDLSGQPRLSPFGHHFVKFTCDSPQLLRRLLLLGGRLIPRLPLRLAQQVTSLTAGLGDNVLRLVGGSLGDLATCLTSVPPDVFGLVASGLSRR